MKSNESLYFNNENTINVSKNNFEQDTIKENLNDNSSISADLIKEYDVEQELELDTISINTDDQNKAE